MTRIESIIYSAVEQIAAAKKKTIDKSRATPLFGEGGQFSSLELVKLVVMIEESIESELGKSVRIMNDKAMSRHNSPFRSLGSFADYLTSLIEEDGN
jgi:D-alanine--poly(phosphoribitol) ligase subunit 2